MAKKAEKSKERTYVKVHEKSHLGKFKIGDTVHIKAKGKVVGVRKHTDHGDMPSMPGHDIGAGEVEVEHDGMDLQPDKNAFDDLASDE